MVTASRRLILTSAVTIPLMLSGCSADFPGGKRLAIYLSSTSTSNSGWKGTFKVKNETNLEGNKGTFNDVTLVGLLNKQTRFCSNSIGEIAPNESHEVSLSCNRTPAIITCNASESPCDNGVVINKLVRIEEEKTKWRSKTEIL